MEHVQKVVDNLMKKEAYDDADHVDIIHTAVSYVFLTGNYAYKCNKPLNLGFLDFTTLESRKDILNKELQLNSFLCPDLYKEVIPITRDKDRISLDGKGKVIEYTLKMKEFPQEGIMSNLLKHNLVTKEHVDKIVNKLVEFHNKTPTDEKISNYGSFDSISALWEENFSQTKDFIEKTITTEQFQEIKKKIEAYLVKNKDLFDKRVQENKIKHTHGDFHSGNIYIGKELHLFDRIAFNMKFPCSDIAAEVAFLAMDLDYHNKKDLSDFFVNQYIKKTDDYDLNKLINFYKCYRAYIRGKIACFKLQDKTISDEERKKSIIEARSYFKLSHGYVPNLT